MERGVWVGMTYEYGGGKYDIDNPNVIGCTKNEVMSHLLQLWRVANMNDILNGYGLAEPQDSAVGTGWTTKRLEFESR